MFVVLDLEVQLIQEHCRQPVLHVLTHIAATESMAVHHSKEVLVGFLVEEVADSIGVLVLLGLVVGDQPQLRPIFLPQKCQQRDCLERDDFPLAPTK